MIDEIRDTLNKNLPTTHSGHLKSRGLFIPLDPWMKGTLRCAKNLGGQGSIWFPDCLTQTSNYSGGGEQILWVKNLWKDLAINSIIMLSGIRYAVLDFSEDPKYGMSLVVDKVFNTRIYPGIDITFWALPVTAEGQVLAGGTGLRLGSGTKLARGDRLEIPVVINDYTATTSHNILSADLVKIDAENYKYDVTLDQAITRTITSNERLWIRAYPAYFSGNIVLPGLGAKLELIGPFLLDYLSGPLTTELKYTEYMSVRSKSINGELLTPYLAAGHNTQINKRSIRKDQFLFWRVVDGLLQWDGIYIICNLNSEGCWRMITPMVPHLYEDVTYSKGIIIAGNISNLLDNEGLTLSDGVITVDLEFKITGTYAETGGAVVVDVSGTTTSSEVAGVLTSTINSLKTSTIVLDKDVLNNNDRFQLFDGITTQIYEFKINGLYVTADNSYIVIDVSGLTTTEAVTKISTVINVNSPGITATATGSEVKIFNHNFSYSNQTISSLDNVLALTISNFEKFNVSALQVGSVVSLINVIAGSTGNVAITNTVASPSFSTKGMSGGGGSLRWACKIVSDGDAEIRVRFHPNADQVFTLISGINSITSVFNASDSPITHIDIRVTALGNDPATQIKFSSWELLTTTTKVVEADIVIQVEGDQFAAGFLIAKPLWPSKDILSFKLDEFKLNSYNILL